MGTYMALQKACPVRLRSWSKVIKVNFVRLLLWNRIQLMPTSLANLARVTWLNERKSISRRRGRTRRPAQGRRAGRAAGGRAGGGGTQGARIQGRHVGSADGRDPGRAHARASRPHGRRRKSERQCERDRWRLACMWDKRSNVRTDRSRTAPRTSGHGQGHGHGHRD
jgi:hypothetical protein